MINKIYVLLFIILIPLNGCAMSITPTQSPGISFHNLSNKVIKDFKCIWSEHRLLGKKLLPGQSISQSFSLGNIKEFYGNVMLTWENAEGRKFEKNFEFTENDLPISEIEDAHKRAKMKDYSRSAHVAFEFTQDGVDFYTSHTPDALARGKRSGKIMNEIIRNSK